MIDYNIQNNKTIILKGKGVIKQIKIDEITHIKCDSYLSTFYYSDNRKPEIYSTLLKEIEKEVGDLGFIRINRNELINMRFINYIKSKQQRTIYLDNKTEFHVSRYRWRSLKCIINNQFLKL